jgi:hypothetical protein
MKFFGQISELVKIVFRQNGQAIELDSNAGTTYTATRIHQLPPGDSSQVLVSATSTQTLTGKTIDGDDNTVQDLALTSLKTALPDADKVLRRDASGVVTSGNSVPNNSPLLTTDSTSTLTGKTIDGDDNTVQDLALTSLKTVLGDANKLLQRDASGIVISGNTVPNTSAIVTLDATQTLTNKSIDADTNTITNIENADIKSGAAIDAAKLADGSVDNTEFQRLGTAGTAGAGNLVTTDGTQTLSNKTLTSPTVDGNLLLQNAAGSQPTLQLSEDPDNGTNKVIIQAPATLASDYTLTLPIDDGASGQSLTTDGNGVLSWATGAGAQDSSADLKNLTLTATVASNALTIALKNKAGNDPSGGDSVNIAFRNSPITSGGYTVVASTAATSIVVPSGATLGHSNNLAAYVYVYALNNAGTVELMVSSTAQDDTALQTTTAIDTASDGLTGKYSTAARTGVTVRLIGKVLSTQTTAGTWASAPSKIVLREETKEAPAMDDALATALGLKAYSHGTTYNGGNAPTITLFGGGGTLNSIANSKFIPKQLQGGSWVLSGSFTANLSSASRNAPTFAIAGITFTHDEPFTFSASQDANFQNAVTTSGTGRLFIVHSTVTTNAYRVNFSNLTLSSKPTWAY